MNTCCRAALGWSAGPAPTYPVPVRRRSGQKPTQWSELPALGDFLAAVGSVALLVERPERLVAFTPDAAALGLVRGQEIVNQQLLQLVRDGFAATAPHEITVTLDSQRELEIRTSQIGESNFLLVLADDAAEARRVDAVRRDFVANISHELKTPIGGIALLAEAIANASDDPDAVRRFAERMQMEARRLNHLVTDIISLSQLQGADPLYGAEVVSVDDVLDTAMDRCRLQAQASEIAMVSGGELGLKTLGNFEQLVTAVSNLLTNAISYSPVKTQVGIGVNLVGGLIEIKVSDQGIGIPHDELERIFERFYRVDPARSRATGGTGLGLAIVKHIVANHGGSIAVWSVEGEGTTFTIRLPQAQLPAGSAA